MEVTKSQRQTALGGLRLRTRVVFTARRCGMEAGGLAPYRTQVKLRKAGLSG